MVLPELSHARIKGFIIQALLVEQMLEERVLGSNSSGGLLHASARWLGRRLARIRPISARAPSRTLVGLLANCVGCCARGPAAVTIRLAGTFESGRPREERLGGGEEVA